MSILAFSISCYSSCFSLESALRQPPKSLRIHLAGQMKIALQLLARQRVAALKFGQLRLEMFVFLIPVASWSAGQSPVFSWRGFFRRSANHLHCFQALHDRTFGGNPFHDRCPSISKAGTIIRQHAEMLGAYRENLSCADSRGLLDEFLACDLVEHESGDVFARDRQ